MRLAWWGFVAIGVALIAVGGVTTLTAQSTITYCQNLIKTVACGSGHVGPAQPRFFMSEASAVTLQEAEMVWVIGIVMVALGLISSAFGVFVLQSKPEQAPLVSA